MSVYLHMFTKDTQEIFINTSHTYTDM